MSNEQKVVELRAEETNSIARYNQAVMVAQEIMQAYLNGIVQSRGLVGSWNVSPDLKTISKSELQIASNEIPLEKDK